MSTDMEQQQQGSHLHSHTHQKSKYGLEWRRNMVLEFISQGRTEREIAQILKVGNGTVHRDVAFLNKQAHDNLKYHINQRVPQQYQRCCNGLKDGLEYCH
jgi:FixJ family two-component response regulator